MNNPPNAKQILDKADAWIKARVVRAHKDETKLKGGAMAPLGYYAALALARDAYEKGMLDALNTIKEIK